MPVTRALITLPTVSVIVRTIPGRSGFLREALASLAAQTFQDLEVIVVEDGGETAQPVLAEVSDRLAVTYLPRPKGGRCVAGNAGLVAARGRYCGFLDDDDQLRPMHLERLVPLLEEHPTRPAVYALAELRETTLHSTQPLRYLEAPGRIVYPAHIPFWPTVLTRNIMPIQSVLFRRELFQRFGGFNPELDHYEDWDLWLRYAQAGMFQCVPEVTSFYRLFSGKGSARQRFQAAQRHLPILTAASQHYCWPVPLADLRAAQSQVVNRDVLRERVWAWIYRSGPRAWLYEGVKGILKRQR